MPNGLLNLALGVAMQVGSPGPSEQPGIQPPANAFGQYGSEGSSEQRYPFDTQQNWVHGYFQEIPAYGGHPVYRPYNYKDVLSQAQTAAGWGERPQMPYSQQFWHKYHDQATMLKTTQAAPSRGSQVWTPSAHSRQVQNVASQTPPMQHYTGWSVAPNSQIMIPQSVPPMSAPPMSSGPLHTPQNFMPTGYPMPPAGFSSGYSDIPAVPPAQSAGEYVNPATYRR